MNEPTRKQLEFLRVVDQSTAYTPDDLASALNVSRSSVAQRLKFCEAEGMIKYTTLGYELTDLGKAAIGAHTRDPEKLDLALGRLASGWPFHLHETYQDSGYGGDVHNKYDRPVASFRNVERARSFLAVIEELLKSNGK